MKNVTPRKTIDSLEKVLQVWREFAPEETFVDVTLAEFEAKVQSSRQARTVIAVKENEVMSAIVIRQNDDLIVWNFKELIVNGVIGNPEFGPDSILYKAMGYIRKSDRRSGLTRKTRALSV